MRKPKEHYFTGLYTRSFWCNLAYGKKREAYYQMDCLRLSELKRLRDWIDKAIKWLEEK